MLSGGVPWVPLVILGALLVEACSGGDDSNGNGHGDAGDVRDDFMDADGIDAEWGDVDEDWSDVDEDADAEDGYVNCDAEERGCINEDYSSLTLGSSQCYPTDMDLLENQIFGVCDYPANKVFSCSLFADHATCSSMANIEPRTRVDDTTFLNNHPTQIVNLGNNRLLAIYTTDGMEPTNGLVLLNATTFEVIRIVNLNAITVTSGSDPVTIMPRQPHSAVLLAGGENLFVTTRNYDPTTGQYEQGAVINLPFLPPPDSEFDIDHFSSTTFFFTSGRNTQNIVALDDTTVAVLNASGDVGEIPSDLAPGEVAGASIDVYDVSSPSAPVLLRNIPIADVKMQDLPDLTVVDGGTRAVMGSATVPPTIYSIDLTTVSAARAADLPVTAASEIASMAYSSSTDNVLVTLKDGYLYTVGLTSMTVGSSELYLGYDPYASVISADGNVLYQAARRACGGDYDDPRLLSVDVTALP